MSHPKSDILTGRREICAYCGEVIIEVQDPYSFVIDWDTANRDGDPSGDFGCGDHPLNDDEGTYGHVPDASRNEEGRYS